MKSQIKEKTKLRGHFHAVYSLNYHLVLVTKYRKRCLRPEQLDFLKQEFGRLFCEWDCRLLEFSGKEDHVHLLFEAHPAMNLSKLINNLKTVTSRLIRKKFPAHLKKYYSKPVFWTRAYCLISTGGATLEVIKKYVENRGNEKSS
ncbi:MAG: IS200/IS605 family transposase [Bdellovibrionales bacterium]|nr:IS200/IS605 family transposase [Bdellovibrionales bacterium]